MSDAIEQLKRVKVPLWAQWLGYWRARRCRKQAAKEIHYVATVFAWTRWTDRGTYSREWWICKETGTGRRFYEHGADSSFLRDNPKRNSEYARIIARWQYGGLTSAQLREYGKKTEEIRHG